MAPLTANTTIYVAEGVYAPDPSFFGAPDPRSASFRFGSAVTVWGGWISGDDVDTAHPSGSPSNTILTGDIGSTPNTLTDDAYHVVTVDAAVVGSTLTQDNLIGLYPELKGFVVERGNADSGIGNGGGLFLSGVLMRMADCRIRNNFAGGNGGGAYLNDSALWMKRCLFKDNVAAGNGGGIYQNNPSPLGELMDVQHPGGFWANIRFAGNRCGNAGGGAHLTGGGGIWGLTAVNCIFRDNSAVNLGGGIYLDQAPTVDIRWINCTVVYNNVVNDNPQGDGDGVFVVRGQRATFVNSIIWNNPVSGPVGSGIDNLCDRQGDIPLSTVVTEHCTIGYSDVPASLQWCNRQTVCDFDPKFVNAIARNLRLQASSPCNDAGNDNLLPEDFVDLNENLNITEVVPMDFHLSPAPVLPVWALRETVVPGGTTAMPCCTLPGFSGVQGAGSSPPGIVDLGAYEVDTNL